MYAFPVKGSAFMQFSAFRKRLYDTYSKGNTMKKTTLFITLFAIITSIINTGCQTPASMPVTMPTGLPVIEESHDPQSLIPKQEVKTHAPENQTPEIGLSADYITIKGVEYHTSLTYLALRNNPVIDWTPVTHVKNVEGSPQNAVEPYPQQNTNAIESKHNDKNDSFLESFEGSDDNTVAASDQAIENLPENGCVIAYTLTKKAFQEFLKKPLIDSSSGCAVFRKSPNREGYIELEGVGVNGTTKSENVSGYFRIGSWPVYTEFIDYMSDLDNFKHVLSTHGVEEQILSCVIIAHFYLETKADEPPPPGTGPMMCIWIHTDAGDYFLEDKPDLAASVLDTNFTYEFYDLEDYSAIYGGK